MSKAKNNQAKSFFSYKNDDVELVDIGQFLRETTDYRVEREWYILFNKMTGEYVSYQETFNGNINIKIGDLIKLRLEKIINSTLELKLKKGLQQSYASIF